MALKEKLIDKAQKLILKGSFDKAVAEYKAAADVDPRDISIRLRIGDLYVKMGKKPEAIKEYTEVAKANAQRGFYLKAIAVYKQVLKLDEANIEVHNKLAELYVKQRLIADAISEYSYIISYFERRGKTSEVLELLKKMVDIDPENMGVRIKLAEFYQKLSFDKDALSEYSFVAERLMSQGKLDKAEKIYTTLYGSNPEDESVLRGLSELYSQKGDINQFVRFAKPLFNLYDGQGRTDEAKATAEAIIGVRGDDRELLRFLSRFRKGHEAAPEVEPAREEVRLPEAGKAEAEKEPFEFSAAKSEAKTEGEALFPTPEEEIEITLEGFEEPAPEAGEIVAEAAAAPVEEAAPEATVEGSAPQVKEEPGDPVVKERGDFVSAEAAEEIEIELEDLIKGELSTAPAVEAKEEAPLEPTVPEEFAGPIEAEAPAVEAEAPVIEVEAPAAAEQAVQVEAEPEAEELRIEEVIAAVEAAAIEEAEAPVAHEPMEGPAEESAPEAVKAAEEEAIAAVPEAIETVAALAQPPQEPPVEAKAPEEEAKAEPEPVIEERSIEYFVESRAEPLDAVSRPIGPEPVIEDVVMEAAAEAVPGPEAVQPVSEVQGDVSTEPVAAAEQEDLSSAIKELMDKIEPEETGAGAVEAGEPVVIEEKVPDAGEKGEEYIDLSAELGMEETLEDLAGSWRGKESVDAFDEFKTGIGKQLSREDSETHYNLGIAYMEMELYAEASKEFRIALRDPRLEFDCYIRLGLCSMAGRNPQEAISYYTRGLRLEGKTEEEAKGIMYELALAYEAAGDMDEAGRLFNDVYDLDPEFRDVEKKAAAFVSTRPRIPLDDGLIEVELL